MKKKISLVTSGHPYFDERIFYKFARTLNKNGYDVSIICSTLESELNLEKDNIHIIGFNGGNLKKSEKVNKFEAYLKTTKPDVIICCEPLPILAADRIRMNNKDVKIIYDVTEWYPHRNMLKNLGKIQRIISFIYLFLFNIYTASLCQLIIIGEKDKSLPYKIFLPFKKIIEIGYYPPYEFFAFTPPPFDNITFTICYVGIINKQRGIFSFLEVTKKLRSLYQNLNINAKIIGDFENDLIKHQISDIINANKLANTSFISRVAYEELSAYLREVDVCLDLREKNIVYNNSFPIKIFEYMACGKPVIYSDIKPLLKFGDLNEFGFLVEPTNVEEVCDKIGLYINNRALLQNHSQAARRLFEMKYSWDRIENLLLYAVKN